ncbi:MAG TPA: hypothetical protein EYH30_06320 [Anaerolineales bacterium]|nr:hypothetical protein [Anaerolineae bacterium]HIQ01729.1 hypothetical protein [Anaerolineales bacterium]
MKRAIGSLALILALLLAVTSLVVSGFTLYGLLRARRAGLTAVTEAREALSSLSDQVIETSIPFHHALPIQAHVPLEQEFIIPIQTTVPFSAVVQVPIQIPVLGTYEMSVPINAEIPLDMQVVVPVSQTVSVETVVAVDTEVPVRLEVGQLGLEELLEQIDAALAEMERGLRWPMTPGKP